MQSEAVIQRVGDGVLYTLRRLTSLARGLFVLTAVISVATFATGWWVFNRDRGAWAVLGGALCIVPAAAAAGAWAMVSATAHFAPRLVDDIRSFVGTPSPSAKVLIDYDSGQPIATAARTFSSVRDDLRSRRGDLPALYVGARAITLVPALAAIAVLGMVAAGGLGTVLLIAGLITH
jgi:hypothetical protein